MTNLGETGDSAQTTHVDQAPKI